jgi:hypothetical protein
MFALQPLGSNCSLSLLTRASILLLVTLFLSRLVTHFMPCQLPSWLIQQVTLIPVVLESWCRDVWFTCTTSHTIWALVSWYSDNGPQFCGVYENMLVGLYLQDHKSTNHWKLLTLDLPRQPHQHYSTHPAFVRHNVVVAMLWYGRILEMHPPAQNIRIQVKYCYDFCSYYLYFLGTSFICFTLLSCIFEKLMSGPINMRFFTVHNTTCTTGWKRTRM